MTSRMKSATMTAKAGSLAGRVKERIVASLLLLRGRILTFLENQRDKASKDQTQRVAQRIVLYMGIAFLVLGMFLILIKIEFTMINFIFIEAGFILCIIYLLWTQGAAMTAFADRKIKENRARFMRQERVALYMGITFMMSGISLMYVELFVPVSNALILNLVFVEIGFILCFIYLFQTKGAAISEYAASLACKIGAKREGFLPPTRQKCLMAPSMGDTPSAPGAPIQSISSLVSVQEEHPAKVEEAQSRTGQFLLGSGGAFFFMGLLILIFLGGALWIRILGFIYMLIGAAAVSRFRSQVQTPKSTELGISDDHTKTADNNAEIAAHNLDVDENRTQQSSSIQEAYNPTGNDKQAPIISNNDQVMSVATPNETGRF